MINKFGKYRYHDKVGDLFDLSPNWVATREFDSRPFMFRDESFFMSV